MSTGLSRSTFSFQALFEKNTPLQIVVSCASGFENLLEDEIKEILSFSASAATKLEVSNASVTLEANLSDVYRICLWSRLAEQVLITIADIQLLEKTQQEAREFFYQEVKKIPWEQLFGLEKTFRIDSSGSQTVFDDERFPSLVFKDAIADRFRFQYEKRPDVERENPDVVLNLHADGNHFYLQVNVAGERLHKRAYRKESVTAPLKETLAAALLRQMQWNRLFPELDFFLDPCCGSGTLVIEALMVAADIAPVYFRLESQAFGFQHLGFHDESLYQQLVQEINLRKEAGLANLKQSGLKLRAYDSDNNAVKACRLNLEAVQLQDYVHVERRAFAHMTALKKEGKEHSKGLLIANPPYGERLQEAEELKFLYRFLGERLRRDFPQWQVGVISSQVELLDAMSFREFTQARFYNGNLKCIFRSSEIPLEEKSAISSDYFLSTLERAEQKTAELDEKAKDFFNRIVKNLRNLKPWLLKSGVNQFRLYDADMPEFNMAIDAYQEADKAFMIVYEYAAPKSISEDVAKTRFNLALQTLRLLFELHREQIFIKTRRKQKGKSQYLAKGENRAVHLIPVHEQGLNFLLNPTDYLDTGLFLDHRLIRQRIMEEVRGKRFLNVFSYTASASVYAAAGGAKSTCSVDLSNNYLQWGRKNFLANGFALDEHRSVCADVMNWLSESKEQFDLIFVDPPTFSNTKKKGLLFDVQKDHEALITLAMKRLDAQGVLYFSTNFRRFEFSDNLKKQFGVKEISKETVSQDFSRKQPHQTWSIRKL